MSLWNPYRRGKTGRSLKALGIAVGCVLAVIVVSTMLAGLGDALHGLTHPGGTGLAPPKPFTPVWAFLAALIGTMFVPLLSFLSASSKSNAVLAMAGIFDLVLLVACVSTPGILKFAAFLLVLTHLAAIAAYSLECELPR